MYSMRFKIYFLSFIVCQKFWNDLKYLETRTNNLENIPSKNSAEIKKNILHHNKFYFYFSKLNLEKFQPIKINTFYNK